MVHTGCRVVGTASETGFIILFLVKTENLLQQAARKNFLFLHALEHGFYFKFSPHTSKIVTEPLKLKSNWDNCFLYFMLLFFYRNECVKSDVGKSGQKSWQMQLFLLPADGVCVKKYSV